MYATDMTSLKGGFSIKKGLEMKKKTILIDFDSTFVTVESLDHLADIVLAERGDKQAVLDEIVAITKLGMEGKITFPESLGKRLKLFSPHKKHVETLTAILQTKITPSFARNKAFFQKNAADVYILSGGFKEYMAPVVREFGIPEGHVLANTFVFDEKGTVVGHDTENPLSQEKGKVKMIQKMGFDGDVYMIGDGYTDWEIKEAGLAKKFIAFAENVARETVVKKADVVAHSFEEVLENL